MDIGHVTVGKRTPRSLSCNHQTLHTLSLLHVSIIVYDPIYFGPSRSTKWRSYVGKRTPRSLSRNYQTLPSLFFIRWYSYFLAIYGQYDPHQVGSIQAQNWRLYVGRPPVITPDTTFSAGGNIWQFETNIKLGMVLQERRDHEYVSTGTKVALL